MHLLAVASTPRAPAARPFLPRALACRLTPSVGLPLAELPLEPQLGAALLAATNRYACCQELLTIAGMLSVPAVWAAPGAVGGRKALEDAKAKFAAAEGDLIAFLNVHRAWLEHGKSHRWCVWARPWRTVACVYPQARHVHTSELTCAQLLSGAVCATSVHDARLRAAAAASLAAPPAHRRATRNGIHQHGMLRAAEVSQQLCRKLKRLGLNTNSSAEGDVDRVGARSRVLCARFASNARGLLVLCKCACMLAGLHCMHASAAAMHVRLHAKHALLLYMRCRAAAALYRLYSRRCSRPSPQGCS